MEKVQTPRLAAVVLILAILVSSVWGLSKKPSAQTVPLPDVAEGEWVYDGEDLLSEETEKQLESFNRQWDDEYHAVCAVAAVRGANGWEWEDYALLLGKKWGLGENDLIFVIAAEDGEWYLTGGDHVMDGMTERDIKAIKDAVDPAFGDGDYDAAAKNLFAALYAVFATL